MRAFALCCGALIAAQTLNLAAQGEGREPLALLDVPFISQSELLCGGASAAMVLRYWGERGISAETFSHLVDRSAAGIRTDVLVDELRRRGWTADGRDGDEAAARRELSNGRPVLTLIEDRPSTFHYVVLVGWHERGVVFHDPARGPFIVMSTGEFARRWRAARRWMAVVVPSETRVKPRSCGSAGLNPAVIDSDEHVRPVGSGRGSAGSIERARTRRSGCLRRLSAARPLRESWRDCGCSRNGGRRRKTLR